MPAVGLGPKTIRRSVAMSDSKGGDDDEIVVAPSDRRGSRRRRQQVGVGWYNEDEPGM